MQRHIRFLGTMFRRLAWPAASLLAALAQPVAAAAPTVENRFTGIWQLNAPKMACDVRLTVPTSGPATLREGSLLTTWKLSYVAVGTNTWKVNAEPVGESGKSDCMFSEHTPHGLTRDAGRDVYLHFLAEDRKMALCTTEDVGGCFRWFKRVGSASAIPVTQGLAAEHIMYSVVPEQEGLFELIPSQPMPMVLPSQKVRGDYQPLLCSPTFAWSVAGDAEGSFGEIRVGTCADGAAISKTIEGLVALARSVREREGLSSIATGESLRYGLVPDSRATPGGGHLYYLGGSLTVGVSINTAVWVSPHGRTIVVQLFGSALCEPNAPYEHSLLCQDRATVLEQIAVQLGKSGRFGAG